MEFRDEDLFPGTRFAAYQGKGDLIVDCGNEQLSQACEFVCGQMADGRLICHCFWSEGELNLWELLRCEQREGALRLLGRTADGLSVSAHCLRHTNFTSPVVYQGRDYRNFASLNAQQINAGSQTLEWADHLRFLLVNLTVEIHGAEWTHGDLTIRMDRVQEYDRIVRLLHAVGGIGVTAAAFVSGPGGTDILKAATLMDNELSVLLSLTRGNLIQWIAVEAQDAKGHTLAWRHRNPVTKPFSPYQFVGDSDTVGFVSETLPGLSALDERWGFRKAVLSLVDAVITTDFIEARGLKAAVTLDFLCGRFRDVAGKPDAARPEPLQAMEQDGQGVHPTAQWRASRDSGHGAPTSTSRRDAQTPAWTQPLRFCNITGSPSAIPEAGCRPSTREATRRYSEHACS